MELFIRKYALNNRVAVSDETNRVAEEVARELKGRIISAPSGSECLTWIIPKRWTVREAYIETLNGKRVVDFKNNPLHLFSYSVPFEGIVPKAQLDKHLKYDRTHQDSIPYHYLFQYAFGEKGWGFCLAYNTYKTMNDARYKVVVDSILDDGVMKIADCLIPGKSDDTIIVITHSCHPAQVNDGLSSVAVALELFKFLKKQKLRYSYRLVVGPEFFGGALFLARATGIAKIRYGILLDMLGSSEHIGISYSFLGNTYIDSVVKRAVAAYDKGFIGVPYREFSGNDECFYDGPDFNIPTVCIGRDDYPEYHLDSDDIAHCNFKKLDEYVELMKSIVRSIETDIVPVRTYKGPLYLSRYGIRKDTASDKAGAIAIDKIQVLMDGKNSCLDISEKLNLSYEFVTGFIKKLVDRKLAVLKPKNML